MSRSALVYCLTIIVKFVFIIFYFYIYLQFYANQLSQRLSFFFDFASWFEQYNNTEESVFCYIRNFCNIASDDLPPILISYWPVASFLNSEVKPDPLYDDTERYSWSRIKTLNYTYCTELVRMVEIWLGLTSLI